MSLRGLIDAADVNALRSLRASLGDASFYELVADQEAVHAALARQFRLLADAPTPPDADAAVADIDAALRRSHDVLCTLLDDASGGAPSREHLEQVYSKTTSHDVEVSATISAEFRKVR